MLVGAPDGFASSGHLWLRDSESVTHLLYWNDHGLEVSYTADQQPAKVILGYKRFEGVLNPVRLKTKEREWEVQSSGKRKKVKDTRTDEYRPRAFSVIAKLTGKIKATGSNGLTASQWFATGVAADLLAKSGAAAALTDDGAVANAVAESVVAGVFSLDPDTVKPVLLRQFAAIVYDNSGAERRQQLDGFAASALPGASTFDAYVNELRSKEADPSDRDYRRLVLLLRDSRTFRTALEDLLKGS